MNRHGCSILSLALLAAPALAQEPEAEADLPPFAVGVDKEQYLRQRADWVAFQRGFPHFLPYDPRARALAEMDAAERSLAPALALPSWTQLGPAPIPNGSTMSFPAPVSGRVSAIAVDPTNPDVVYAGAAQGGVYRSTNGGTSWTQIFDSAESLAIGALALAPSDPSILYVGTGESALSADSFAGVGLYRIEQAATVAELHGPFNPAVTTGIAGTTAFTGRAISEILVHPTNPAVIFVSTTSGTSGNPGAQPGFTVPPLAMRGVYRSNDATGPSPGFTKLKVTTGGSLPPDDTGELSITDIAIDPVNPDVLVAWVLDTAATAGAGGIYRSTNALAGVPVFSQVLTTTTTGVRAELGAQNVAGPNATFYAATGESNGRLRKSTDGGATWSAFLTGAVNFCNPQCFYDIAIDVHPTNPNVLNVGGSPTLIAGRSTDGGSTFTTNGTSAAGLHVDTHAFVISRSDPSVVYVGNDGGIFRSNDGGMSWTSLNNTDFHATQFQSLALHPTDRQFLIGGTQDNGTQFLRPDGTWIRADGGDGGYALIDQGATDTTNVVMYHTYFNQVGTQIGFARVTNVANAVPGGWPFFGCVGSSSSNGIGCSPSSVLFYAPMALGPGSPNTLYFGTDQLFRSIDLGGTMPSASQVLVPGSAITTIAISPVNDGVRLAGLRNGRIWATTTGAAVLTEVTAAAMPDPHPQDTNLRRAVSRAIFHPTDPGTVYVAFGGYGVAAGEHVWKTTNLAGGAASWVAAGSGIPDVPVNALAIDPDSPDTLFAGTDIGVFVTRNGGVSWTPFSAGLPRVAVFDLAIYDGAERVVRAATHGRGIWEIEADTLFADGFESADAGAWSSTTP
jgi:photosystem II stability/assembly factor-like uncharacterized protein